MAVLKKRCWAFVLYPESAPKNWVEILRSRGVVCAISPLHDKDKNPDGTLKKAHYHVLCVWQGPTSSSVVNKLTQDLNQPNPIALESCKGYYRYLTHRDNPEKFQYSESDIQKLNGFSISDFVEMTRSEVSKCRREILGLIQANSIDEYCVLIDFLMMHGTDEQFEVASNSTIFLNAYLTSKRHCAVR